jgi:hypothetical protein
MRPQGPPSDTCSDFAEARYGDRGGGMSNSGTPNFDAGRGCRGIAFMLPETFEAHLLCGWLARPCDRIPNVHDRLGPHLSLAVHKSPIRLRRAKYSPSFMPQPRDLIISGDALGALFIDARQNAGHSITCQTHPCNSHR